MTERQAKILHILVERYISTAQPVASSVLADAWTEPVSSATIRHECAQLEAEGYIEQPHTSAGRIPTEKGYLFYSQEVAGAVLPTATQRSMLRAAEGADPEQALKNIAKAIVEETKNACFVGFKPGNHYYTGLTSLLSQPEFQNHDVVLSLSNVIDHLDVVLYHLYDRVDTPVITVGSGCAFGPSCAAIMARTKFKGLDAFIAIVGPTRMSYADNHALISFIHSLT